MAQLSVKYKLDCIINGCAYLTFSALVMWKNAQVPQRKVPMSNFYFQERIAFRVVSSIGGGGGGYQVVKEEGGWTGGDNNDEESWRD